MESYISDSKGFKISVKTEFDFEKSNPLRFYYVFQYHITIENVSATTAQLLSRKWFISNANGKEDVVEGPGVIGKRPVLSKGQSFSYSSFCPLSTMTGKMHGKFFMKSAGDGDTFDIETPEFFFSIPEEYTTL